MPRRPRSTTSSTATGRDVYDVRGRVAHESIFNTNDGSYRCPNSQQGYSPFTTWTRGLAWVLPVSPKSWSSWQPRHDECWNRWAACRGRAALSESGQGDRRFLHRRTRPTDGIPYWDTGAPGLARLGDYLGRPADPFNDQEPVDSSAAAIAAQGLIRLGNTSCTRAPPRPEPDTCARD